MAHDRYEAGDALAQRLADSGLGAGALMIGIPRGGVVVATRAAMKLDIDYECVPVCRISMPCFPDLTLGALDPDGVATFDPKSEVTRHEVGKVGGALAQRLKEQVERCRGGRPSVDLSGRDVIVVDEALDNDIVPRAIAGYLRRHGVRRITYSVPVSVFGMTDRIDKLFDNVVAVQYAAPAQVIEWYGEEQPSDDEIHTCLVSAWDREIS